MKKHFVTFYSPGTLFAETTREPIENWDVDQALAARIRQDAEKPEGRDGA